MPYILKGTKDLISYWESLSRPCNIFQMASAIKKPAIYFMNGGREEQTITLQYEEPEAQALAALLGVGVSDVTTNGGQIQT